MVLSAHNLWSHVARSPTRVLIIFSFDRASDSKIRNSHIPFRIKDKVFRLDVSMNNFLVMDILEAEQNGSNEELGLFLSKFPFPADVIAKITSIE